MADFTLKAASTADIGLIISLQQKIWEPTYREILSSAQINYMFDLLYSPESLSRQMQDGQEFYLLLQNNEPIGFASVAWLAAHIYKLHKIYVLPSVQGTGAGKYLLEAVETLVKDLGGNCLILNVNRFNKAKGFYERMGYQVIREEDIAIGPYWMNDFVLEKSFV